MQFDKNISTELVERDMFEIVVEHGPAHPLRPHKPYFAGAPTKGPANHQTTRPSLPPPITQKSITTLQPAPSPPTPHPSRPLRDLPSAVRQPKVWPWCFGLVIIGKDQDRRTFRQNICMLGKRVGGMWKDGSPCKDMSFLKRRFLLNKQCLF